MHRSTEENSLRGLGTSIREKDKEEKLYYFSAVLYYILSIPYIEALAKGAATKTEGARMQKENNRKVENGDNAVLHDGKQHANSIFPMNQYPPDSSAPSNKFC